MSDSDDSEGNYGPGMACAYTDDSDDEDAESSDDDEQDARIELSSADGVEGELMTKGAKKSGWDKNGHRKSNGRAMRSAVRQTPSSYPEGAVGVNAPEQTFFS